MLEYIELNSLQPHPTFKILCKSVQVAWGCIDAAFPPTLILILHFWSTLIVLVC